MALWGWTEADWGYVNCERLWLGGGLRRRWHTWLGDIVQPRKTILQSGCSFETRTFRNEIALMAGSCRREWIGRKLTDRMQKWECVDRRLYRYPSELLCGRKDAFLRVPLRSMLARCSPESEKLRLSHGDLAVVFESEIVFTISKVGKGFCLYERCWIRYIGC